MDISETDPGANFAALLDEDETKGLRTYEWEIMHACHICEKPSTSVLAYCIDRFYSLGKREERTRLGERTHHAWYPSDPLYFGFWPDESNDCIRTASDCAALGERDTADFIIEMGKCFRQRGNISDKKTICRFLAAENPNNLIKFSKDFELWEGLSTAEYLSKNVSKKTDFRTDTHWTTVARRLWPTRSILH